MIKYSEIDSEAPNIRQQRRLLESLWKLIRTDSQSVK